MINKPISGSPKSFEDSKKSKFDRSRPAESAYAIFRNVAPTVLKIQSVKAKNLQHNSPKTGFSSINLEKPQFFHNKGRLSTENSQFDSLCRAKSNGEVPKHEKFTILEIKTDTVANKKIFKF